ncbi:nuclear transport factor 2 family protein [Larkinella terrae]|uniref:SnoaL-like domain-containing protein n=1 Tax=Larkinella terrae TaxID=2025311 RepID=A0A7K0EG36_9BACT|nr:nuclear transport factor 2 family protein [Larkinella terrae]MRS60408.1 hypothetical protein [Larkinella terrae]
MQNIEFNKSIIRDFYRRTVANGDLDFAEQIIANDYIQHSPRVKPGKAGLLEALAAMKQLPKPASTTKPFMRLIAENDWVVTNLSFEMGGQPMAVIDLFRLRNGQVVEHWDAMQKQPETTLNGHPMLGGVVEIEDVPATEANKKTVAEFYERVLVNRKVGLLSDYVASDLIQHVPEIANGADGLRQYWQQKGDGFVVQNVLRIIGEGNFVVVQADGQLDQKPVTFYDVFRLSQGKIVEQWGVKQNY